MDNRNAREELLEVIKLCEQVLAEHGIELKEITRVLSREKCNG